MGFPIYIASKGGDDDDVDGRDTESPDGEGADDGDPDGIAVELCPLTQTEGRYGNQRHHGWTDAPEDGCHVWVVLKLTEEDSDGQDNQKRG